MSTPITHPCRLFRAEVFERWPQLVDLGYYNRRKIAGTQTWSQHAWGNAQDLAGPTQYLDLVAVWLSTHKTRLKIRTLLWRVPDHYDHIHVDFTPKQTGTPPYPSEDDVDEVVKGIQRSLNGAGFRDQTGAPLTVDGQWGPKTEYAYGRMCVAAKELTLPDTLTISGGRLDLG